MKVLTVVGTRPEAIKMAPVIRHMKQTQGCTVAVCLTAQHRELLDGVIRLFRISADYDLDLMRPGQTITDITCRVLTGMADVLEDARPDVILIHGDTTTSFAAALAAYYRHIPAGHVEAGLRTHDKYRPFPEEMNRRLGDALCDYHYAPTEGARRNLLREGIPESGILVTGNTIVDAVRDIASRPHTFADPVLAAAGESRRLILVTAHRRESFGAPLRDMCRAMRDLVREHDDVELLYPVHPNPEVTAAAGELLSGQARIHLIAPVDYAAFVHLIKKSYLVLTDSGGIQEEAPSLRKPVLVMRDVTERPEAVEAGAARLVGTRYEGIMEGVRRLLEDSNAYQAMTSAENPFGDGHAGARIAQHVTTAGRV